MTKIFFAYKHVEKPWGGANNFIRSLYNELKANSDFVIDNENDSDADVLFFNQLSRGPGNGRILGEKRYSLSEIKKIRNKNGAKLVVRPVNLKIQYDRPRGMKSWIYYLMNNFLLDLSIIRLVNMADFVIFQSEYQRNFFKHWGYKKNSNAVVHNGASPVFEKAHSDRHETHNPLRIVATSSSSKKVKKCELISRMSLIEGVEMIHIGNWPKEIGKNNVATRGILNHDQIADIYRNADYFLHPAILDVCPNAIIEALYSGLPVIYSKGEGSSSEIVMGNGIPIDEIDLEATVNLAKKRHEELKKKLADDRNYYSIKRAASQYADIFNKFKKKNYGTSGF